MLLTLIKLTFEMASLAYWNNKYHCGGNFDKRSCEDCNYYNACLLDE